MCLIDFLVFRQQKTMSYPLLSIIVIHLLQRQGSTNHHMVVTSLLNVLPPPPSMGTSFMDDPYSPVPNNSAPPTPYYFSDFLSDPSLPFLIWTPRLLIFQILFCRYFKHLQIFEVQTLKCVYLNFVSSETILQIAFLPYLQL